MPKFHPLELKLQRQGYKLVAGVDEAGRGPLAGPVVSAAVILKKGARLPNLDDSKKLSKQQRAELFSKVINSAVDYSITAVSAKIIDQENILNATRIANDLCISALSSKPDIVLIDGRDKQIIEIPFITIVKGDSYIKSIAAASILAKVTRDAIMEEYHQDYPNYCFNQHMGYGTRLHREIIEKDGRCPIHRYSFQLQHEKIK